MDSDVRDSDVRDSDVRDRVGGDVWRLRREVIQHPVHRWASQPVDLTTLRVHKGFAQWASTALAASVGIPGPGRHLELTIGALRRAGAGRCLESFLDQIQVGCTPLAAVAVSGAPAPAQPLARIVGELLANGADETRLGAFTLGMPCCTADQGPALDRLGRPTGEAVEAARAVLDAHVALYDGALHGGRPPAAEGGAETAVGSWPPWTPMGFDAPSPRSSPSAVTPSCPPPA